MLFIQQANDFLHKYGSSDIINPEVQESEMKIVEGGAVHMSRGIFSLQRRLLPAGRRGNWQPIPRSYRMRSKLE